MFRMEGNDRISLHDIGHVFLRELATGQMRRDAYPAHVGKSVEAYLRRCNWKYTGPT